MSAETHVHGVMFWTPTGAEATLDKKLDRDGEDSYTVRDSPQLDVFVIVQCLTCDHFTRWSFANNRPLPDGGDMRFVTVLVRDMVNPDAPSWSDHAGEYGLPIPPHFATFCNSRGCAARILGLATLPGSIR